MALNPQENGPDHGLYRGHRLRRLWPVYLQVDLKPPTEFFPRTSRKPTDFVVVLDKSGSMADAKKMTYARKAVESLVNQLRPDDRFALVTFDDTVQTPIELSFAAENRDRWIKRIRSVEPGG